MRRLLDACFNAAAALAAGCVLMICALMIFQSIGREFGLRVGGINDIVAWLCAASSFLAMAHAFKHGDFVRVTLLLERLPPARRRWLEATALGVATVSVGYLAWWAVRFTWESWEFGEMAGGLVVIPIWIPQLSFAAGALLLWLAVTDEFVRVLRGEVPTYVRLVEERHAQGDFSSDV